MKKTYNSLLFVPSKEHMLKNINHCDADAVIIDLEDSILEVEKDDALAKARCFLEKYSYKVDAFVRINPQRIDVETDVLNAFDIKGYMLPKTESASDIEKLFMRSRDKSIIALVESARGLMNLKEIAGCNRVAMLAFGAEDYTARCGIKNRDAFLSYPKSKIVVCAKAYGKQVFDSISLNIRNESTYRAEAELSKDYGFDGKLAIHPMQVEIINEVFAEKNIEFYKYIISQYENSATGVLNIDGRIYEKPHIDAMKRKIMNI